MNKAFLLILFLICSCVYFNALSNNFALDDVFLIINNPLIKSEKLLGEVFKNSIDRYSSVVLRPLNIMYRPLQILSYFIDYKIWKLNHFGFHLSNVLLHLFNAILVYYLLRMVLNEAVAKIAGIMFLVHPIHTSVVSYVSSRADLLVLFFILLSSVLFVRFLNNRKKGLLVTSLCCAALALLSRENAMLLFIFIALILFATKARPKDYMLILHFLSLNLFYLLLRFIVLGQDAIAMHQPLLPIAYRALNFFNILPRYLLLLVLPANLHMYRTTPFITALSDARVFLAVLFIISVVSITVRFKNDRALLFGVFWFMAGLFPVFMYLDSYEVMKEAMMAESWLYISSIGFFAIFARLFTSLKKVGIVLSACFLVAFGFLTVVNNSYWKNDYILYENILANTSERNYLRINLIMRYIKDGFLEDARREIAKFSVHYPGNVYEYYLWGNYYFANGQTEKAIENFNRVLNMESGFFYVHYYLSLCYERLKQYDEAIAAALNCVKINPYYLPNLVKLGDLYLKTGQVLQAKRYYGLALEVQPDNRLIKEKIKNAE